MRVYMKEAKIANNSSWDQIFSSLHRSLILVSKLKWWGKKIYSSLDQLVLGTFLSAHRLHAKVGRTRGLQTQRTSFWEMSKFFWRDSINYKLYINKAYLLLRDAELLLRNSIYKLKINTSFWGIPFQNSEVLIPYILSIERFLTFKEQKSLK